MIYGSDESIDQKIKNALEDTVHNEELNNFIHEYYQLALSGNLKGKYLVELREGILRLTNNKPDQYPKSVASLVTTVYQKEVSSGYGLHLF